MRVMLARAVRPSQVLVVAAVRAVQLFVQLDCLLASWPHLGAHRIQPGVSPWDGIGRPGGPAEGRRVSEREPDPTRRQWQHLG